VGAGYEEHLPEGEDPEWDRSTFGIYSMNGDYANVGDKSDINSFFVNGSILFKSGLPANFPVSGNEEKCFVWTGEGNIAQQSVLIGKNIHGVVGRGNFLIGEDNVVDTELSTIIGSANNSGGNTLRNFLVGKFNNIVGSNSIVVGDQNNMNANCPSNDNSVYVLGSNNNIHGINGMLPRVIIGREGLPLRAGEPILRH